jgi:hypothetical protein
MFCANGSSSQGRSTCLGMQTLSISKLLNSLLRRLSAFLFASRKAAGHFICLFLPSACPRSAGPAQRLSSLTEWSLAAAPPLPLTFQHRPPTPPPALRTLQPRELLNTVPSISMLPAFSPQDVICCQAFGSSRLKFFRHTVCVYHISRSQRFQCMNRHCSLVWREKIVRLASGPDFIEAVLRNASHRCPS